jgi:hypothetical protein
MRVQMLAAVTLTTVVACSTSSPSAAPAVPVAATPSDLKPLVGKWEGEYSSESTGRSGSIVFELKAGATEARGDVLMVPRGSDRPLAPARLGNAEALRTMPQVLSIRFVNAQGGVISGVLEPYRDPDCDCRVETNFVGTLKDDTIEGTFTTVVSPTGAASTGRWKVTRKK